MPRTLLAACLVLACASAWAQTEPSEPPRRMRQPVQRDAAQPIAPVPPAASTLVPFVDAHVHLNSLPMQLELMQRWGASHAVVFWGGRSSNESVAEAARQHPGVLIPFASISPERTAYRPQWEQPHGDELLKQLDAMLATGLYKGIGEISVAHFPSGGFAETDFAVNGPMMTGILTLARKHKVPVMVHVESTRMAELSQLLQRFADVPVIWAHGGYTPLFLARRMLEQHPNLYYELSARTWPHHPRSPDYTILRDGTRAWPEWLQLIEDMPDRFLVGTDASHRSASSDAMKYASVQSFLAQLPPSAREQVARGTLFKLVGISP
ncbi:amidohydrolase family protein [Acidovorax sp. sic0104]|uniref:amidohydrolase family protein n=1 Tax=Acidovorax sp. sic0104 TaxID=2854784 RepID=UPI001C47573C|nr:TatD family hydrolase [Acidovorax sp. sic0104]MBV7540199.1 amidohydrolase [Acidovorax sp. sic0104]